MRERFRNNVWIISWLRLSDRQPNFSKVTGSLKKLFLLRGSSIYTAAYVVCSESITGITVLKGSGYERLHNLEHISGIWRELFFTSYIL